jgi:hypothetical protein
MYRSIMRVGRIVGRALDAMSICYCLWAYEYLLRFHIARYEMNAGGTTEAQPFVPNAAVCCGDGRFFCIC